MGGRMPQCDQSNEQDRAPTPQSAKIIELILSECEDSSRLLEFYYWSREPGMLEIIRTLIALPEGTRASIEAFLTMSHEPAAIVAAWDAAGRLTLSSPQVGQAMAIMRHCAADDDAETPPVAN